MTSSDRRIAAARKIEESPRVGDTWPAPPPSSGQVTESGEVESHDTIPTPPPESGIADVVVVPPLRELDLESELGGEPSDDPS